MEDIISTCQMVNPKMKAAFVITQCPALPCMASRILQAKEVCRSFDMPVLDAITFSRNIYDDSEEKRVVGDGIRPKWQGSQRNSANRRRNAVTKRGVHPL
jgi:hypothetical protein